MDGNIHPDEWTNDVLAYFNIKQIRLVNINDIKSLVVPTIKLPTGID